MTAAFDLLKIGDLFGSIMYPFIDLMGADMFYLLLMLSAYLGIYVKTRNVSLVSLTMILTGGVIMQYASQTLSTYMFGVVMVGVALALYSAFKPQ